MPDLYTPAQVAAINFKNQVANLQNQKKNLAGPASRLQATLTNGIPSRGENAAVSPEDLAAALGSDLAEINAFLASLVS
jgi:hypothetical protein